MDILPMVLNRIIMQRTKWVDREFNLGIPEGWLPNILTRLSGVTIRLKNVSSNQSDEFLSKQLNGSWSIKEHIGHLVDLEDLHIGRVIDFVNRKETLRPADMSNKQTYSANHNKKSITKLIDEFASKRNILVLSLNNLDDKTQRYSSMHPRLKVPMKSVDMAFFTAEHDEHHISSMYEILETLK